MQHTVEYTELTGVSEEHSLVSILYEKWQLIQKVSEYEYIVAPYDENQTERWRLWIEGRPASEITAFILPHHDKSLSRITTAQQLRDLSAYHADKWKTDLQLVSAGKTIGHTPGKSMYPMLDAELVRQETARGLAKLKQRRTDGLPDVPTIEEVQAYTDKQFQSYLNKDSGWYIGDDELLYRHQWLLQRQS